MSSNAVSMVRFARAAKRQPRRRAAQVPVSGPGRTGGGTGSPSPAAARWFLALGGGLVLASEALPTPRLLQDLVYSVMSLAVLVAIVIGVRRYRPRSTRGWYLMALGQAFWVLADTTFNWQQDVLHVDTFPTISDGFYLAGYPCMALGLTLLVKERTRRRRDIGPWLDSATVTAGMGLLSWILLARPTIESMHHSTGAAIVAAAYPVMDIMLIGALVRLVHAPSGRAPAFRLLLMALGLLIAADTLSVAFDLFATNTVSIVEYLWLFSYVAWGAAALHPSMAELSEPLSDTTIEFRGTRLMAVVLATLIAPALLAVHEVTGVPVDVWAVIIGSVVMFLLVVGRMNVAIGQFAAAHDALETLQDELAQQASHDPLTGLVNRTQAMRLLAGALGRSRRSGAQMGLLFIDLDGFKNVNDTHGHRAGDAVLRQVATRMAQEIRDGDFVGRLGGDEFVVGVEDVSDEQAVVALAERLIASVSEDVSVDEGLTVRVGASVGVALGRGGETDVESLLHEADIAVYAAKGAGRGCVKVVDRSAREALRHHNDLERALARAIAQDELVLHFQPIVHLGTGQTECYEALVRWNRPGVGLLQPDEFLPVAETTDLICELDAWVLRKAVAELARWNGERRDHRLQVAVNISGRHMSKPRILDDVTMALRVPDVLPPQLVVEVTETAVMDGAACATNLEALRHLGVVVSLDDYGTGYQSTAQLARLPLDVLKIDRQFVNTTSAAGHSLLELMVTTAHAFGARVVAEGVERADQLDLARRLGCEYAQGYHLGPPAPADQISPREQGGLLAG